MTPFSGTRRRRLFGGALVASGLAVAQLTLTAPAQAATLPASPESIRVATFNINGNAQTRTSLGLAPFAEALPGMATGIRGFDVVALQGLASVEQLNALAATAGYPYTAWTGPAIDVRAATSPDVALLSRTPIGNATRVELPKPGCVLGINCGAPAWAVTGNVVVGGVLVSVVSTALSADSPGNDRSAWRLAQAQYLRFRWANPPTRVAVMGDFRGENYLAEGGGLTDSYRTAQRGLIRMPAGHLSDTCGTRQDRIYLQTSMDVTGYDGVYASTEAGCGPTRISDHARISAILALDVARTPGSQSLRWSDVTGFSGVTGPLTADTTASVEYGGTEWVFYRSNDARLRVVSTDGSRWWDDRLVPGGPYFRGSPTVAVWRNQVHVFARGSDGRIWGNAFKGAWNGWGAVPGSDTLQDPSIAVVGQDLHLVRVGTDSRVYVNRYTTNWTGWAAVPGSVPNAASRATAATWQGNLHLFVRGADNQVWGNAAVNGLAWNGWAAVPDSYTLSAPAMASATPTYLQLAIRGKDDRVYRRDYVPGQGWSGWSVIPSGRTFTGPAIVSLSRGHQARIAGPDGRLYGSFLPYFN